MDGFKNEFQFVLKLNNKKVGELNPLLKEFVCGLFYGINDKMIIKSWRNHYQQQKTDVMIKIGQVIKGISIKMGSRNSVHVESLNNFIDFLSQNDIPQDIIEIYIKYHYGDGTLDGSGFNRLSSKEYTINHKKEINILNKYLSNKELIEKATKRFILFGNNSEYSIDAIVYGTPEDFLWLTPKEIIKTQIDNKDKYSTAPHIGNLYIQPLGRCLNRNFKYSYTRKYIQIKWYSLFDDIVYIMNEKINKLI